MLDGNFQRDSVHVLGRVIFSIAPPKMGLRENKDLKPVSRIIHETSVVRVRISDDYGGYL